MDDAPAGDRSIMPSTQLLLVPRVPGPLLTVDLTMGRPRDDLDVLIDDLFGEPVKERSGLLDAVLVIAGILLLAWSLLDGSLLLAGLGVVAIVLGLALPTRDALGRLRGRRIEARLERARAQGMLLDVSVPDTRQLARAYGRLLAVAGRVAGTDGVEAAAAGHLAVTEVASLLRGAPPRLPAELEYVERRTEAIADLGTALETSLRRAEARAAEDRAHEAQEAAEDVARTTTAREELGAVGGLGSLVQLETLAAQARRRPDDVPV